MPSFRLTAKARDDLKSIGHFTQQRWGRDQRNNYLAQLDESFHVLAREPHKGRACNDIREGYRKYRVGRHLIFYRESGGGIEIVRILHQRMDLEAHLS